MSKSVYQNTVVGSARSTSRRSKLCTKKKKKFRVAGFQGKIHAGWSLPPESPPTIQTSMEDLLKHELVKIRVEVSEEKRRTISKLNKRGRFRAYEK